MAHYNVTFSCGHTERISLFGKDKDRQRKIAYFEEHGVCSECYEKSLREVPIKMYAAMSPNIIEANGNIQVTLMLTGYTKDKKEELKAAGFRWKSVPLRSGCDDMDICSDCWQMDVEAKTLSDVVLAMDLNDQSNENERILDNAMNATIAEVSVIAEKIGAVPPKKLAYKNGWRAIEAHKEWVLRREKLGAIEKPTVPDTVKGTRWNQKIYGKSGNYSIYPDGNKLMITDEQAEELRQYLAAKAEYYAKVDEIK